MSNGMNDPFLGNLLKDIQKNKKFVDDLMRRELKEVFDESRTTDVRDDLDEAVSRCNGELYDVFYSLGGIRTTLVEMEVRHG
nr:MAG TPA: hypothetical protein [Caudoviricetes sp.]